MYTLYLFFFNKRKNFVNDSFIHSFIFFFLRNRNLNKIKKIFKNNKKKKFICEIFDIIPSTKPRHKRVWLQCRIYFQNAY
jgi:hypothetical protein